MNVAIIAAAGIGKRLGGQGKQYLLLRNEPLLAHTLRVFQECSLIGQIIVVNNKEDIHRCQELVSSYQFDKVKQVIEGGSERQDSVANALGVLPGQTETVAVHDGARPLITQEIMERSFAELENWDGVVVGVPVKDTLKQVEDKKIIKTLDRRNIWHIQTPQIFQTDLLIKAYQKAKDDGFYGTDDAALVERIDCRVGIVPGSYENIKITTPEDLVIVEAILAGRAERPISD